MILNLKFLYGDQHWVKIFLNFKINFFPFFTFYLLHIRVKLGKQIIVNPCWNLALTIWIYVLYSWLSILSRSYLRATLNFYFFSLLALSIFLTFTIFYLVMKMEVESLAHVYNKIHSVNWVQWYFSYLTIFVCMGINSKKRDYNQLSIIIIFN